MGAVPAAAAAPGTAQTKEHKSKYSRSGPGLPPSWCMNSLLLKGARLTFKTWGKKNPTNPVFNFFFFPFFVLMNYNGTFKSVFFTTFYIYI